MLLRDGEHPPDAAGEDGVQLPSEAAEDGVDLWRHLHHRSPVPPGGRIAREVRGIVGMQRSSPARLAVLGQEVERQAIEHGADLGFRRPLVPLQAAEITDEQLVARMPRGAVREKRLDPAVDTVEDAQEPLGGGLTDHRRLEVARAADEKPLQRRPRDQAALQQRREAGACTRDPELRDDEGNVTLGPGQ